MAEYNRLLSQRVAAYASEINRLKALVAKLQRMQFGKSFRKTSCKNRTGRYQKRGESALQEEMAETLGEQYDPALPSPCASLLPVNRYRPHFPVKPRLSGERNALLPVVVNSVLWDVMCQSNWSFISSAFKVIETQRPKLACCRCDHIVQAPVPSKPIARSYAGAGLLAHVVAGDVQNHLPLYRQSEIYPSSGSGAEPCHTGALDRCRC